MLHALGMVTDTAHPSRSLGRRATAIRQVVTPGDCLAGLVVRDGSRDLDCIAVPDRRVVLPVADEIGLQCSGAIHDRCAPGR